MTSNQLSHQANLIATRNAATNERNAESNAKTAAANQLNAYTNRRKQAYDEHTWFWNNLFSAGAEIVGGLIGW